MAGSLTIGDITISAVPAIATTPPRLRPDLAHGADNHDAALDADAAGPHHAPVDDTPPSTDNIAAALDAAVNDARATVGDPPLPIFVHDPVKP